LEKHSTLLAAHYEHFLPDHLPKPEIDFRETPEVPGGFVAEQTRRGGAAPEASTAE
jgi:hypothetical protein